MPGYSQSRTPHHDVFVGVVQKHHLADVAIKNPSLKFKPNQKLKAKVLTVDPAKRRLNLTLKRSIVKNRLKCGKDGSWE